MTQCDRLLAFLRRYPDSPPSSLDIVLHAGILNTTGRISDLRKRGHRIDCKRAADGVERYYLVEKPEQLAWTA